MKITTILLLSASLTASAGGFAQNVTLTTKNMRLEKVFKEIKKQTGYVFFYDANLLKRTKPVTIDVKNESVREALKECLEGKPLDFSIERKTITIIKRAGYSLNKGLLISNVLSPLPPLAQEIKGTVKDDKGNPLAGVSVVVKGTSKGTSTGNDGSFFIDANMGDVLEFSMVGYTKKSVTVQQNNNLYVVMEIEVSVANEVVVVGYGTQKQQNLTGAITKIDNKVLEDRPITRLSEGLQGAVANLNITQNAGNNGGGAPNATQSINIRGYTGLGVSQGPLLVIDGVQGGDINAINPSDVESITVIKDAAAAAIYGSSAPYGVLLITTKKGHKGGKPTISYNNNLTFAQPIGLPKMLNSITFANLYNEALANAGRSPFFSVDAIERMKEYQAGTFKDQTVADTTGGANSYETWGGANANNDWFKIFFRKFTFRQQHNISVSGGNENTTYYVGAGYNDNTGLYNFGTDSYKRFNLRANISTKVTKWMTFNFRSAYSKEMFNTPNYGGNETGNNWMHQLARKHPNIPTVNPDGHYSESSDIQFQKYAGRHITNNDAPIITGEFVLRLAKGWDATANYTYDASFYNSSDATKTLYGYHPKGDIYPLTWSYPNDISKYNSNNNHQVFNAFSSYDTRFNKHHFTILGGFVAELTKFTAASAYNNNLYSNDLPSLNLTYGTTPSVSDQIRQLATEGFFGRFNYDYDGKYLLELVGRYDGTSRFLADKRWKLYPGISAGWNIHRENFWKESIAKYVNTFKIRGSYGKLGDQSMASFSSDPWRQTYPFYPSLGTVSPANSNWIFNNGTEAYVTPPGLVDPSLTWITTATLDFGTDITFLDNRLSVSFDWYKRNATNYIGPAQALPSVLGTSAPVTNSAAMETKGFELTINWRDQIGAVNYGIRGTLSNYKGVVTKYPNPTGLLNNWYVGENMGEIWGFQTVGYFKSAADVAKSPDQSYLWGSWGPGDIKYADLNGDGKINYGNNTVADHGDLKVIGNSTPQYAYSALADASWKNLDISVFLQGIAKRDSWMGSNYFWGITGSEWQSSPFTTNLDRWTPSNPNGYFPKYYMSGEVGKNEQTQTKYLLNTAYMRIKNLQVGYSLPQTLLKRTGLEKVRVFISVDNLLTITPMSVHSMLDPELSISDAKIYPLQRSYSFGVNVSL